MKINKKMNLTKTQEDQIKSLYIKNEKMHNRLFLMLKDIDGAFKRAGIKYTLIAGTLLGAELYSDFIPGDDDVDIAIRYCDMKNTLRNLEKYLPPKYKVISSFNNKKYQYPYIKVLNTESKLEKKEFGEKSRFAYQFIDITIYQNTNGVKKPKMINFWGKLLGVKNIDVNGFVNILCKIFLVFPTFFINNKILKNMNKLGKEGNKSIEIFPFSKTVDISLDFENIEYINFHGEKFPAIKNRVDFLENHYKKGNTSIYDFPKKMVNHDIKTN